MKCLYCENEHDGSYGSGRFCSRTCSSKYSNSFVSSEGRKKQIKALNDEGNRKKVRETRRKKSLERQRIYLQNKELQENYQKQYKEIVRKHKDEKRENSKGGCIHRLKSGKIGELATIKKFIERGYDVYTPVVDTGIDLVIDMNGELKKVQVKSSSDLNGVNGDITVFKTTRNKRTIKSGHYEQKQIKYGENEIDYFSFYDIYDDELYLMENKNLKNSVYIHKNVSDSPHFTSYNAKYAHKYQIDKVLDDIENNVVYDAEFVEIDGDEEPEIPGKISTTAIMRTLNDALRKLKERGITVNGED